MAINFIVKENVEKEIIEIIDWYNYKQADLRERFYKELLLEFENIKQHSTLYAFYSKEFRRAVLKNFPYLIIFKVLPAEIVIYTVVYGGRSPKLIKTRIN